MAATFEELCQFGNKELDRVLPQLARDPLLVGSFQQRIAKPVVSVRRGDARNLAFIRDETAHLVLTSPPYWTLKDYDTIGNQLGNVVDYEEFLTEIDRVWSEAHRILVPGGRLVIVVGDVNVARRANGGRHKVYPLHADIQTRCARLGWENLTPILWHKIASARFEASGNSGTFFGKPFQPGAIIKNDVEYILIFRKPGNRSPSPEQRLLSLLAVEEHRAWFRQVWTDLPGVSRRDHPAAFPEELARRLIRMFSFVGDTVVDPFVGSGTTLVAAYKAGRNSIGVDVSREYLQVAKRRILAATGAARQDSTHRLVNKPQRPK